MFLLSPQDVYICLKYICPLVSLPLDHTWFQCTALLWKTNFDRMMKNKGTILTSDLNLKPNVSLNLKDHRILCFHKLEVLTLQLKLWFLTAIISLMIISTKIPAVIWSTSKSSITTHIGIMIGCASGGIWQPYSELCLHLSFLAKLQINEVIVASQCSFYWSELNYSLSVQNTHVCASCS